MSEGPSPLLFETVRRWVALALAVLAVLGLAALVYALWANRFDPVLTDLVMRNFPMIIGLPFASVAAFIVVALFKQSENAIEFDAMGIRLKGAAGEIVLWLICFVAIVVAIAFLWKG